MIKRVSEALAKRGNGDKGFTLIELLVVVIIIGILAAVAIPVFLNMREGAWKASVESDVANAVLAVEQAAAANNGSLANMAGVTATSPTATTRTYDLNLTGASTPALAKGSFSEGNSIAIDFTGQTYEITGYNTDYGATKTYVYTSSTGTSDWTP